MCKVSVRVRNTLKPHAGDVDAAAVPCGFGRAIGNKVYTFGCFFIAYCYDNISL